MASTMETIKDKLTGHKTHTTNAGPHDTKAANKTDPRVDSDLDHRDNPRFAASEASTTAHSDAANTNTSADAEYHKLDHGADTNVNNRAGLAYSVSSTTGGPGSAMTPDTDDSSTLSGTTTSGPAPNTAGPHSSDMANKLDPRVDSDLDGSRALGGHYA